MDQGQGTIIADDGGRKKPKSNLRLRLSYTTHNEMGSADFDFAVDCEIGMGLLLVAR